MTYHNIFATFANMGVIDVILPFILVFTIVFAILQKVKILGGGGDDTGKKYNVVVALVMGLAVVFPHVLWGTGGPKLANGFTDVVFVINNSLPSVAVIAVAIVMMLLLIGVFGKQYDIGASNVGGWVAFASFAIVTWVFGAKAGWWTFPIWLGWLLADPEIMTLLIVILVFGIIVWMITSEEKEEQGGIGKFFEEVGEGIQPRK